MTTTLTPFSTKLDVAAASMTELVSFYNSSRPADKAIKKFETRAKGVARCTALLKEEGAPAPTGVDPEKASRAEVAKIAKAEPTARKEARKPSGGVVIARTEDGEVRRVVKGRSPTAMDQMAATVVKPAAKKSKKPTPSKKAEKAPNKRKNKVTARKPDGTRGKALFTEDSVITLKVAKGENPKRGTAADRFDLYRSGMTVKAYIAAGGQRRDVVWDQHQAWISVK
jgi:hypothetical protein